MIRTCGCLLFVCFTLAGCGAIPHGGTQAVPVEPHEEAMAISSAFAANNAKLWRKAVTTQLARTDGMSGEELAVAATEHRRVATERGIQGLEATLVSTLAALGQYDYTGWLHARDELAMLSKVLAASPESPHLQARVAMKSAGNPAIHHIPLPFARSLLNAQIQRGLNAQSLDIDSVLKGSMCSEEAIARFEARYGKNYADTLRSICQGNSDGPSSGRTGPGPLAGMSEFSCLSEHQSTRAERVSTLIDACLSSQSEAGSNPLGQGRVPGRHYGSYLLERVPNNEVVDEPIKGVTDFVDPNAPVDSTGQRPRSVRFEERKDGTKKITWYEPNANNYPVETESVTFDKDGNETGYSAIDKDGHKVEIINIDGGGYTFRESHTENGVVIIDIENTYDKDGKIVSGVGNPSTGWGKTSECRELTMALMRDSAKSLLESHGLVNPHSVRPDRESDALLTGVGEFGCFDLTGSAQMDASFFCADGLKLCGPRQIVDENCQCTGISQGLTPSAMCSLNMNCTEGLPTEVNGQCSCPNGEELFVDSKAGGGPKPLPVLMNRSTRRTNR